MRYDPARQGLTPSPDIDRPDVESPSSISVPVEDPEQQRAVADATLAAWDATPWPDGLISRTCYVSSDGQRVLTYEQWRAGHADVWSLPGAIAFRLYRSGVRDDAPVPGCIVIVEVQTDGPETARRGSTPFLTPWRPKPRCTPAASPATSTSAWTARAC